MDLQAAKDLDAGMWRFARIGVLACFALAGALLVSQLLKPAMTKAEASSHPGIHMSSSPAALPSG